MLREVPMNARVYIGLKLLFANGGRDFKEFPV